MTEIQHLDMSSHGIYDLTVSVQTGSACQKFHSQLNLALDFGVVHKISAHRSNTAWN